jgi:hypothetical protein
LQAAAEEAKALDEVAMHAAMQAAAEAARKAWPSQRQQVKKEPTEQLPDAPNVKQEATEVRPAPPTNKFGGLGEYRHYRVRPGNRAQNVTINQIKGAFDAEDLTTPPTTSTPWSGGAPQRSADGSGERPQRFVSRVFICYFCYC